MLTLTEKKVWRTWGWLHKSIADMLFFLETDWAPAPLLPYAGKAFAPAALFSLAVLERWHDSMPTGLLEGQLPALLPLFMDYLRNSAVLQARLLDDEAAEDGSALEIKDDSGDEMAEELEATGDGDEDVVAELQAHRARERKAQRERADRCVLAVGGLVHD